MSELHYEKVENVELLLQFGKTDASSNAVQNR